MQDYIFSSAVKESEYKRLCLIQDSFDSKSHNHLIKAGLRESMDVLEVGLGAGSLASWMSEVVGKKGSVLAVDLNADHVTSQNEYSILEGNILDLDIAKTFDVIHLRYVLIHNPKSKDIIKKLYSLLKPGGKLVMEEPDFTLAKWIDAQSLDGCKRVNSAMCKMFEKKGLKPYYGSVAHLSLEEAGFDVDESKSYLHLCSGGDNVAQLMSLSTQSLQDVYVQTGICSQDDIQAYIQACQDKESLAVYYATIALIASRNDKAKEIKIMPKSNEEVIELKEEYSDGIYLASSNDEILRCFTLMKELRPELKEENFLSQIKAQIQNGYHLYYFSYAGEIVSLAGCAVRTNLAWGRYLYIDDLISSENNRSNGYGKEILEYVKNFARSEGCEEIHLDSGVQRFGAHKFYLREGFFISSHHFSYKIEM